MSVLVDTSIWSLALRRRDSRTSSHVKRLEKLVEEGRVRLIGPIRQEILSGIAHAQQFDRLQAFLEAFPDESILTADYETAARMFNTCRAAGVQGGHIDFLICAVASRLGDEIYTTDSDFKRYAKHLPIGLFSTTRS